MAFAIHQHESARGIPVSPPSPPLPPAPGPPSCHREYWIELPVSYIKSPLAIYFTYGNIYASMLVPQIILP